MDGPPPLPSPRRAQGLEVFACRPSTHLLQYPPIRLDGCLHMEPQRDIDSGIPESSTAVWTEVTARTQSYLEGNFLSFKVAQKQPGLLQRVCEQIQSVPSSCASFLISEAWAMGFLGDHTQQLTEATVASCLSAGSPDLPREAGNVGEGGEGVSVCPAGWGWR